MSIIKAAGAGEVSTGFFSYKLNQSLRFEDGDNAYLSRTPGSAGNRQTWTVSFWIQFTKDGTEEYLFSCGSSSNETWLRKNSAGTIQFQTNGGVNANKTTSAVYRDVSSWYHILMRFDSTDSTSADRTKLYVNGVLQAWTGNNASSNESTQWNNNTGHRIGERNSTGGGNFSGYIAEFHNVDGTALDPTSFGETKDGVWVPKEYTGSHGTNGFYLPFDDSSAIGDDESANTNDFTVNNLAASDVVPDSPTLNHCNIVPMPNTSLSEGNLKLTTSRTGYWDGTIGSFGVTSGKWYHEVRFSKTETNFRCVAGWIGNQAAQTTVLNGKGVTSDPKAVLFDNYAVTSWLTSFYKDGGNDGTMTAPSSGDVINIAADFDNGKIWFGVNGTYYANDGGTDGDPGAGTNESLSGIDLTASEYVPFFMIRSDNSAGGNVMIANFGADDTFAGNETAGGNTDGNGRGSFYNTVPSGFLALCSSNLPDITIGPGQSEQADDHFNTALWSGNSTDDRDIVTGHATDFVWIKSRSNATNHYLFDSVRGVNKQLLSNATSAEATISSDRMTAFNTDGFQVGAFTETNGSGRTFVGWSWRAGGSASSNTDGSITSSVSANPDAGFSIVSWTGTGATGTIGHGLSSAPEMIIVKNREISSDWQVYHKDTTDAPTHVLFLDLSDKNTDQARFNDTTPTSSVFSIGNGQAENKSSDGIIAYCFHSVEGYSKVGSYKGNGSADGTFVHTGFRPAWIMTKREDSTSNWLIYDNKRNPSNLAGTLLEANTADADETNSTGIDFLSNGIKMRNTFGGMNTSGGSYVYLAFAEQPFKFANAR